MRKSLPEALLVEAIWGSFTALIQIVQSGSKCVSEVITLQSLLFKLSGYNIVQS